MRSACARTPGQKKSDFALKTVLNGGAGNKSRAFVGENASDVEKCAKSRIAGQYFNISLAIVLERAPSSMRIMGID